MQNDNSKVYFKKLTTDEKLSKIFQLSRHARAEILFWKKGAQKKETLLVDSFLRERNQINVTLSSQSKIESGDYLFNFLLNGVQYFGSVKAVRQGFQLSLFPSDEFYKSERRSNFRLLTYPHQQVYAYIKFKVDGQTAESNLFQFKTGLNETNLFKNFLKIVDQEIELEESGYIKFRVIDVSVTGLALQMGEHERDLFESKKMEISNMLLDFNGKNIKIPKAKILYFLNFLANDKKTKMYKAGVEFLDIDTNLDERLSHIINKTLRSLEDEFEDFYK